MVYGEGQPDGEPVGRGDARRAAIQQAAIEQFSMRGFAGTSMANIAEAAGVSRPALYQYFRDKDDVLTSAFVAVFDERVVQSLAALDQPGDTAARLDGFLQRFEGDLWERMAASPHTDELVHRKKQTMSTALEPVVERLWAGLEDFLKRALPGRGAERTARRQYWLTLLRLSPHGLRSDQPSVEEYRRRLTALAHTVAAEVDGSQTERQ